MQVREIVPNLLYQSGHLSSASELMNVRIKAIVNLDQEDGYVPYGCTYIHWPIEDGPIPFEPILNTMADLVFVFVEQGFPILIRCAAGLNRSGLLTACVLHRMYDSWEGRRILAYIRARVPMALCNDVFASYVETIH